MRSIVAVITLASSVMILALVSVGSTANGRQEPKKQDLRPFMREKLKHAQYLIEGLANEDFAMIRDNAHSLREIAGDAQWKVSPDVTYIKYSGEFASIADELERRAAERDLNGATLSYIRLTINCVDCHKFARDNRIMGSKRR